MENLKILSLGRNQIKKLENMDAVSDTLEELWISYNLLDKLVNSPHDHDLFPPRMANIAHPLMLENLTRLAGSTVLEHSHSCQNFHVRSRQMTRDWRGAPCCLPLVQVGIEKLTNLRVLFAANNKISAWSDVERLAVLDKLEDLLLVGNPLFNEYKDKNAISDYRIEVSHATSPANMSVSTPQ
jgi:Leucine-rich repeat (LRR) protein